VKSAIFQAALVVFGVVLAFAANEWREAAADRRRAGEALTSIREELAANRDAAAASAAYHAEKLSLIVELSSLYDMQTVYLNQTLTAGTIIYERMFDDGVGAIPANADGLSAFISTFRYREEALVAAYDAALK
jgi:type II secretory pathway pseudopilin PulG